MDVNPRQYDPEFQDPNAPDSERKSQFGMQSQADMPLAGAPNNSAWGQRDVVASTPVYGRDEKKVGTVQEAARDYFMVKKGIFFVHDYYIPYSAIATSDPERIVLTITSDEAKQQDWQQPPLSGGTGTAGGLAGGTTGGLAGGAAAGQMSGQQPPEYGVYGPEGSEDTVQAATERGTEGGKMGTPDRPSADQPLTPPASSPDYTPQFPPGSAAPNRPAAGSAATSPDTPIPMGPPSPRRGDHQGDHQGERQGDMPYRDIMGPADQPDAADRAYNPGWQGTGGSGRDSASDLPQPEMDPTSWNPDQQRPNDGSRS